jgi:predicted MFS family arabinose efflux permease
MNETAKSNETLQNNNKRAARVITTAALVSIFIYSFIVSLPGILINEVVEAFSLEGADEGYMGALTSLGFLFSLFFVVMVQGRAKKTTVLAGAFGAQAIMLFISGFSPTFFLFLIGCTLIGFSGGFIDTYTNSAIVDVRKNDSARYLGYLHGLFGVGSLLVPIVYIWASRYIDWRGAHYSLAIVSLLVMLMICLISRAKRENGETKALHVHEHLFTKSDLLNYFKVKRNVALVLAGFFSMYAIASVMVWIVRYMALRFDAAELGALSISVYWICSTANRFLLSQIIIRAPMKFLALGAALSGVFILIGVFAGNPIILCVMMGLFGLSSGHFVPVLVSSCAKGYGGKTTFTTSLIMLWMALGRIAAPILIAYVSTRISLTTGMMLPVAAAFLTVCCGLYAIKSDNKERYGH